MKISNTLKKYSSLLAILFICPISLHSASLITSDGSSFSGAISIWTGQGYRIGWDTTDSVQNASISAWLWARYSPITGEAYLTTSIGNGTTVSNEIASTSFTFPTTATSVTLFSNLQLAPGQYYLSIIGTSPAIDGYAGGWVIGTGTTSANPDTVYSGNYGANYPLNSYFPASGAYLEQGSSDPGFSVQGTIIPEPSTFISIIVGIGLLALRRKRRMSNNTLHTNGSPGGLFKSAGIVSPAQSRMLHPQPPRLRLVPFCCQPPVPESRG